jgi:predicted DNA-binding protein
MATELPRVNITMDKQLFGMLSLFAKHEGSSLSAAAKELIKLGLEMQEDIYFSKLSEERLAKGGKNIPHKDAWK